MNILLSAFSFEPTESSEPGVAWRFAQIAAQSHRVWVMTADFPTCVARTMSYFGANPHPNIEVVPFWPRGIARTLNGERVNLQYWFWQRQVVHEAIRLHKSHRFSLVHQLTFSRYWTPSSLCRLPIPFVWGPVGSAESTPRAFMHTLPLVNRLQSRVRDALRRVSELDPLLRLCARRATATFATTPEALEKVKTLGARNARLLPQVVFSQERLDHFAQLPPPATMLPLRILSIGRSLYWKGFQYGLEAAARLKQRGIPFRYTIVGSGPFEPNLRKTAARLQIAADTEFVSRVEGDISAAIGKCHVLMHPALHETFGNVCLEALAAGRPVICLNVGGPATQVTPECGLAAPIDSPEKAVGAMAAKLEQIATQVDVWSAMSEAAKARAQAGFHINLARDTILETYERFGVQHTV